MTYTPDSFSAGETPSSAKWNELWNNDAAFQAALLTGWVNPLEIWTYASNSGSLGTITIPSGGISRYQPGDKIQFTQGGSPLFFYVFSVTDTTLVICGGNSFTLANTAIANNMISRASTAVGFPAHFDLPNGAWSVIGGTQGASANAADYFSMEGLQLSYVSSFQININPGSSSAAILTINPSIQGYVRESSCLANMSIQNPLGSDLISDYGSVPAVYSASIGKFYGLAVMNTITAQVTLSAKFNI